MKPCILFFAATAFLGLAACSSAGHTGVAADSNLTQTEGWALNGMQASQVLAALKSSGIAGQATSASLKTYATKLSCVSDTSCSLTDVGNISQPGTPTNASTANSSALFNALTMIGVASDGPLVDINLACTFETFTNTTETNCSISRDVDKPAANERTITTGTGAKLTWGSISRETTSGSNDFAWVTTYEMTYEDAGGYFGNAAAVSATLVETTHVAHHGGLPDGPKTSSFDVVLAKTASHTFKATFVITAPGGIGDWQTDVDALAAAFHVGDKWDSNGGQNYGL